MSLDKLVERLKGGPGSGDHGHSGRPGKRGGSSGGSMTVYHGTSVVTAANLKKYGFQQTITNVGMSSTPNSTFTFVSPVKKAAAYYAQSNIRYRDSEVLKLKLRGKLLELEGRMADYEAFGEVARKFGVNDGDLYDLDKIAVQLKKHGYSGISFKDSLAGGRMTQAVLPEFLELE